MALSFSFSLLLLLLFPPFFLPFIYFVVFSYLMGRNQSVVKGHHPSSFPLSLYLIRPPSSFSQKTRVSCRAPCIPDSIYYSSPSSSFFPFFPFFFFIPSPNLKANEMSLPFCSSHLSDPGTIAKLPTRRVLIVNDQLSCNKQLFINLSFLSLFSFLFLFYFHSLRLVYHIHSLSPISRCDFSSFLFCPSVRPSVHVPQPKVKGPFFFVALSGSERVIRRGLCVFFFLIFLGGFFLPRAFHFSSNIYTQRRTCHSRRRFLGFCQYFQSR